MAKEEPSIRLLVAEDRARSRITVALRLPLAAPHLVLLVVWGVAALAAAAANWLATAASGRPPSPLHRFLARYVRYSVHTFAYLYLVADRFPGFAGKQGTYPVDVVIAGPSLQSRSRAAFRPVLAIPPFVLASVLHVVMAAVAVPAWFVALASARVPAGMRDLSLYCLRYQSETAAYLFVLGDRYPSIAAPATAR